MDAFAVTGARVVGWRAGSMRDIRDGWVLVREGRIVDAGAAAATLPTGVVRLDARALAGPSPLVTPGLIDIHNHGGGGHAVESGIDAIRGTLAAHAAHGVTRLVASLVSAPERELRAQLAAIAEVADADGGLLGAHLEGPCLDPGHRGAHDPRALREPDPDLLDRLIAAGPVLQVTLAPELPGADAAILRLRAAGVTVALGHTGADAQVARAAFDSGATVLTHAFNAMRGLHHRAIGPVGAALEDPRVFLEVIADGIHLDPVVVRTLFAAAPERVVLVSDAMAAAGMADGSYRLGGLPVEVADGRAVVAGTETIAGSTLTLGRAVRNAAEWGIPLLDVISAATVAPARALARDDLGRLDDGLPADLVLWDGDLRPIRVWREGEILSTVDGAEQ
ncbi:N-acetylglucosamine-6-phosphate deacetylase [Microbacterium stercoris]|uniref:N-acetylglucosamine-6-phosphate deacetylase n=1 Tax=Microbacterium stercoris TaxID=2820289 RepID=A0A939QHX2_9MICO|nr:N-acetylglucosamine-6-phosphate deacetylase [Microbacterium stercoris]MBO3661992.1 N-acetylglucosamine-6-phosphate deacetylase [Microbacterium stercoris]